jgi:dipeptidase E
MSDRKLLLLSNSRNADGAFLDHARESIRAHVGSVKRVLFVPYAGVTITAEVYTALVRTTFAEIGVTVQSVHESPDPAGAVRHAECIVVGGGNTFRLLERLQHYDVLAAIRTRVAAGVPYIGWSAGSVVAGPSIATTNDMPIVAPNGFAALGLVDFHINAHFTDAHPPGFRGETRRERLAEFLVLNPSARAVGLPEGSWLEVVGRRITLAGPHNAPCLSASGTRTLLAGTDVSAELEPKDAST